MKSTSTSTRRNLLRSALDPALLQVTRARYEPGAKWPCETEARGNSLVRASLRDNCRVSIPPPLKQQTLVALDLEGVLVPEIWIAVAERTGIDELRRTTRDEPDYDLLMKYRLALLDEHGLSMSLIADVIGTLEPLPGGLEFLDRLRARTQVMILSDTFEQFAAPLMRQLGMPAILCHQLVVEHDQIVDYALRMPDQKCRAVEAFRSLNYRVVAAGDSYNDATMLGAAHQGIWFHAPQTIAAEFPAYPFTDTYDDLYAAIEAAL